MKSVMSIKQIIKNYISKCAMRAAILTVAGALIVLPCVAAHAGDVLDSPITSNALARKIIAPVRRHETVLSTVRKLTKFCVMSINVKVGQPKATLATLIVLPKKRNRVHLKKKDNCSLETPRHVHRVTVLLLPGYGMPKTALLPYAKAMAQDGMAAVMVDLRAQGESTGDHVGYGKREADDLRELVKKLHKIGLASKSIGIFGISYGAAVALDAAAVVSDVKAVVAIGPYAHVATAVEAFSKISAPKMAVDISPITMQRALALAGDIVGYPLSLSDPLQWVGKIKAHVLYIAGGYDHITPLPDIRNLSDGTAHSSLAVIKNKNHITLVTDTTELKRYALGWFRRFLLSKKYAETTRK